MLSSGLWCSTRYPVLIFFSSICLFLCYGEMIGGWLSKKGGERRNWSRRWFQQDYEQRDLLHYYDDETCEVQKGTIVMSHIEKVTHLPEYEGGDGLHRIYTFELVTVERVFYLQTETADELNGWVYYFKKRAKENHSSGRISALVDDVKARGPVYQHGPPKPPPRQRLPGGILLQGDDSLQPSGPTRFAADLRPSDPGPSPSPRSADIAKQSRTGIAKTEELPQQRRPAVALRDGTEQIAALPLQTDADRCDKPSQKFMILASKAPAGMAAPARQAPVRPADRVDLVEQYRSRSAASRMDDRLSESGGSSSHGVSPAAAPLPSLQTLRPPPPGLGGIGSAAGSAARLPRPPAPSSEVATEPPASSSTLSFSSPSISMAPAVLPAPSASIGSPQETEAVQTRAAGREGGGGVVGGSARGNNASSYYSDEEDGSQRARPVFAPLGGVAGYVGRAAETASPKQGTYAEYGQQTPPAPQAAETQSRAPAGRSTAPAEKGPGLAVSPFVGERGSPLHALRAPDPSVGRPPMRHADVLDGPRDGPSSPVVNSSPRAPPREFAYNAPVPAPMPAVSERQTATARSNVPFRADRLRAASGAMTDPVSAAQQDELMKVLGRRRMLEQNR